MEKRMNLFNGLGKSAFLKAYGRGNGTFDLVVKDRGNQYFFEGVATADSGLFEQLQRGTSLNKLFVCSTENRTLKQPYFHSAKKGNNRRSNFIRRLFNDFSMEEGAVC